MKDNSHKTRFKVVQQRCANVRAARPAFRSAFGSFIPAMRLSIFFMIALTMASRADHPGKDNKQHYREDRILAKPKQGAAANMLEAFRTHHAGKVLRKYPRLGNIEVIELQRGQDVTTAINALNETGLFEYVEPDYLVQTFVTPNDTLFTNLWGLHNTGQSGGTNDADIDAPEGWDIQNTATNIIVADTDICFVGSAAIASHVGPLIQAVSSQKPEIPPPVFGSSCPVSRMEHFHGETTTKKNHNKERDH